MRISPLALAILASVPIAGLAGCGGGSGSGSGIVAAAPADGGADGGGSGDGGGGSGGSGSSSGGGASTSSTVEGGQSGGQTNEQQSSDAGGTASASVAPLSGSTLTATRGQGLETVSDQGGQWRRHADGPDAAIVMAPDGGRTLTLPDGRQATLHADGVVGDRQSYSGTIAGSPDTPVTMLSSQWAANLTYTDYGLWAEGSGTAAGMAVYAVGLPTPLAGMPATGSAEYRGGADGLATVDGTNYTFTGNSTLRADFSQGTISGRISGLQARTDAGGPAGTMNDIALSGAINGNGFAGTAVPSATPGQIDIGATSGGFGGRFHGPAAEEVGGSFTLDGDGDMVTGSFGAARR